jgi:16S rRNA (guanine527-N7)-methyltransferase
MVSVHLNEKTQGKLNLYMQQLRRWNDAINLVARSDGEDWWQRHVVDSLQLFRYVRSSTRWVDLGTGAGFPGMVLAICASGQSMDTEFVLVESDSRKCEFLKAVSRETAVSTTIVNDRIESIAPLNADVVTSRALGSLTQLCKMAQKHMKPAGQAVFLKGSSLEGEILEARKTWNFKHKIEQSVTSQRGYVVVIESISRA